LTSKTTTARLPQHRALLSGHLRADGYGRKGTT